MVVWSHCRWTFICSAKVGRQRSKIDLHAARHTPEAAKQAQVQGRISLDCVVGKNESVKKIKVKAGHALLVKAATDAVSPWKFKPLLLNGKAVEVETAVEVVFQLPKVEKKTGQGKPSA